MGSRGDMEKISTYFVLDSNRLRHHYRRRMTSVLMAPMLVEFGLKTFHTAQNVVCLPKKNVLFDCQVFSGKVSDMDIIIVAVAFENTVIAFVDARIYGHNEKEIPAFRLQGYSVTYDAIVGWHLGTWNDDILKNACDNSRNSTRIGDRLERRRHPPVGLLCQKVGNASNGGTRYPSGRPRSVIFIRKYFSFHFRLICSPGFHWFRLLLLVQVSSIDGWTLCILVADSFRMHKVHSSKLSALEMHQVSFKLNFDPSWAA
ncbi:conserved hypothetical protein [Trichinella spiralis]|uniref:hypothetical protein n=1 Tax=Trichinella spiralis TaxID=6334 RepID=UPI0001EFCAE8|nr:conserved hypothetical protein [Trichinella spiralis]